jgi:hypothetical protein
MKHRFRKSVRMIIMDNDGYKKMFRVGKKKTINIFRTVLGEVNYTKLKFLVLQRYKLNLKSPRSLSEKIQWIKLFGDIENLSKYIDKYEVRDYVKEKIGESYLIPLIGVYKDINEINFSALPNSFIIKATHASGWNLIVRNKSQINWDKEKKIIESWLGSSFYQETGERNYKNIKGRVVIEHLINDPSGDLKDFKFFCFDGKPEFIQVDGDRYGYHKRDLYNTDWSRVPVKLQHENLERPLSKPKLFNELLTIASSLSSDFKFVRVDLYFTGENIYFGELTFTPGQGFERFSPKQVDFNYGNYLKLESNSIKK